MANFFTSLFSSSSVEESTDGISKSDRKKFDILKYDGVRAQKIGKLPYAIKCFTEALAIQEDLETMSYLVGAYTMVHEPEKALEVLDEMVAINPEQLNTLFTRVSVLFLLNRDEEAVEECNRIISYDPSNHLAFHLMGRARKNKGDLELALGDISKAIELNADFLDAYLLRSEIYLKMENGVSALKDIEEVIAREAEEENACLLRGTIHVFLKDMTAAEEDFYKVLELNPFNEDASLQLAELLVATDRLTEALEVLDDLVELSPSLSKAYSERSKLKSLMGDAAGAVEDEQKTQELRNEVSEQTAQADFSNMYKGGIF